MIDVAKKSIVFDIDDTIANLKEPMCAALNKFTGKNIHWKDWTDDITNDKIYNIDFKIMCDIIINQNILENLIPLEETDEVLTRVKQMGYNLLYVTARDYHPFAYDITKKWFDSWKLPYDQIYISSRSRKKIDCISDYKNIVAFIDDNIDNCKQFKNYDSCNYSIMKFESSNKLKSEEEQKLSCDFKIHNLREVVDFLEKIEN